MEKNKKVVSVLVGVILLIVVAGVVVAKMREKEVEDQSSLLPAIYTEDTEGLTKGDTQGAVTTKPRMVETTVAPTDAAPSPTTKRVSVDVTVEGGNFSFSPAEIRVKKGEAVHLVFKNNEGFHDFVIDELNVRTEKIKAGATETVDFVVDKAGTFEYYCSVGSHRAMGMKGNLIVE